MSAFMNSAPAGREGGPAVVGRPGRNEPRSGGSVRPAR